MKQKVGIFSDGTGPPTECGEAQCVTTALTILCWQRYELEVLFPVPSVCHSDASTDSGFVSHSGSFTSRFFCIVGTCRSTFLWPLGCCLCARVQNPEIHLDQWVCLGPLLGGCSFSLPAALTRWSKVEFDPRGGRPPTAGAVSKRSARVSSLCS